MPADATTAEIAPTAIAPSGSTIVGQPVGNEATLAAPEKSNAALEKLFRHIGEVSSLPVVALNILRLTDDPQAATSDLLEAVEGDPALAVRIIRRVNSSAYALRSKVADLRTAISLLGFREIRMLALTVFVSRMFRQQGDYRTYSRQRLWQHMHATGTATRIIAQEIGIERPDEAFVAGLLHDIGYILLDQQLRRQFCLVLDELEPSKPTWKIEQRLLPFDHAELGAYVCRLWGIPGQICDCIAAHHQPASYRGQHEKLVHAVSVANYLTTRNGLSSLGVANVELPAAISLTKLELTGDQLRAISERIEQLVDPSNSLAST